MTIVWKHRSGMQPLLSASWSNLDDVLLQHMMPFQLEQDLLQLAAVSRQARRAVEHYSQQELARIMVKHRVDATFAHRIREPFAHVTRDEEDPPFRCLLWAALRTYLYRLVDETIDAGAYFVFDKAPVISPSGELAAFVLRTNEGEQHTVCFWNLQTRQCMRTIVIERNSFHDFLLFESAVAIENSGMMRVWSTVTWEVIYQVTYDDSRSLFNMITVNKTDLLFVRGMGTLKIVDTRNGQVRTLTKMKNFFPYGLHDEIDYIHFDFVQDSRWLLFEATIPFDYDSSQNRLYILDLEKLSISKPLLVREDDPDYDEGFSSAHYKQSIRRSNCQLMHVFRGRNGFEFFNIIDGQLAPHRPPPACYFGGILGMVGPRTARIDGGRGVIARVGSRLQVHNTWSGERERSFESPAGLNPAEGVVLESRNEFLVQWKAGFEEDHDRAFVAAYLVARSGA